MDPNDFIHLLVEIRDVQREHLEEYRRVTKESLEMQRKATQEQFRLGRLYRRVVFLGAILLAAGIIMILLALGALGALGIFRFRGFELHRRLPSGSDKIPP